jgi:hypothetical protein
MRSHLNFHLYEENFILFFISAADFGCSGCTKKYNSQMTVQKSYASLLKLLAALCDCFRPLPSIVFFLGLCTLYSVQCKATL